MFNDAYVKLDRTKKFIAELEAELDRYRGSNPLRARFDTQEPGIALEWDGIGSAPSAIIGDAIHNLRTALDLMASELARLNGKSDKDVYFPFSDTGDTFNDAIKRRNFHKAGDDAVALIKTYEPYRGGNDALRSIHDLDVRDKHTALVVVGHTQQIGIAGGYDLANLANHAVTVTEHHIDYIFPENGAFFPGRNVIETLKDLVQLVNSILEAFARMVETRA